MPMYNYRCPNGHQFEDLNTIANRHKQECFRCGEIADMVISAPRIDPNADLPGLRMSQRRRMEERGRGKDMWAGNREAGEDARREAHDVRKALGETKIIASG